MKNLLLGLILFSGVVFAGGDTLPFIVSGTSHQKVVCKRGDAYINDELKDGWKITHIAQSTDAICVVLER